jgi:glycerol uptake operon antiterminator
LDRLNNLPPRAVFLLGANLLELEDLVARVARAGHLPFVHLDLVEGLKTDSAGVRFIAQRVDPFGVISTHKSVIEAAASCGLVGILRVFLLDSEALRKGKQLVSFAKPHLVELLPGVSLIPIPDRMLSDFASPIIAGGLVEDIDQVHAILRKGALGVSTSQSSLW